MSMMSGKDGGTARRLGKAGPDNNASSDNGGDRRRGADGVVSMGRCVATGLRGGSVVESIIVCLFMSAEFGFYDIRLRFSCKMDYQCGNLKAAWAAPLAVLISVFGLCLVTSWQYYLLLFSCRVRQFVMQSFLMTLFVFFAVLCLCGFVDLYVDT